MRFSDPYLNRFLQPDTIIPNQYNPQSLNRYSYVNNSPINYSDPTGHWMTEGCGDGKSQCKADPSTNEEQVNTQKLTKLRRESDDRQCHNGDKNYCSYVENHPVESAVTIAGGLVAGPAVEAFVLGGGATFAGIGGSTATTLCAANPAECEEESQTIGDVISTGSNTVYTYVENGVTKYVGITNDFARRAGEHLSGRGWVIEPIQGLENLSRSDARAVEQVLIEQNGITNLYNQINSIAVTNPIYQQAIQRGNEILNALGIGN